MKEGPFKFGNQATRQLPSSRTLSRTSAKGRFRRFDCTSVNDCFWRIPEMLPAAFASRLRLQSGLREVVRPRD